MERQTCYALRGGTAPAAASVISGITGRYLSFEQAFDLVHDAATLLVVNMSFIAGATSPNMM